jgi:hypothetical protein
MNKAKKLAMGLLIFSNHEVKIEIENSYSCKRIYVKVMEDDFKNESSMLEKYGWWKNWSNIWTFDLDQDE